MIFGTCFSANGSTSIAAVMRLPDALSIVRKLSHVVPLAVESSLTRIFLFCDELSFRWPFKKFGDI